MALSNDLADHRQAVIEAALERCRLALTRDDHAEARRNEEIAALDAVLRERGV